MSEIDKYIAHGIEARRAGEASAQEWLAIEIVEKKRLLPEVIVELPRLAALGRTHGSPGTWGVYGGAVERGWPIAEVPTPDLYQIQAFIQEVDKSEPVHFIGIDGKLYPGKLDRGESYIVAGSGQQVMVDGFFGKKEEWKNVPNPSVRPERVSSRDMKGILITIGGIVVKYGLERSWENIKRVIK